MLYSVELSIGTFRYYVCRYLCCNVCMYVSVYCVGQIVCKLVEQLCLSHDLSRTPSPTGHHGMHAPQQTVTEEPLDLVGVLSKHSGYQTYNS